MNKVYCYCCCYCYLKLGGWGGGGAGSIVLGVYFEREEGGRREPLLFNSVLSGIGWGWGGMQTEDHSFLGTYFQEQGEMHKNISRGRRREKGDCLFLLRKGRGRGGSVTILGWRGWERALKAPPVGHFTLRQRGGQCNSILGWMGWERALNAPPVDHFALKWK